MINTIVKWKRRSTIAEQVSNLRLFSLVREYRKSKSYTCNAINLEWRRKSKCRTYVSYNLVN